MRSDRWLKKWRGAETSTEEAESSGGRRGSGVFRRMAHMWRRADDEPGGHEAESTTAVSPASPFSHGLF